MSRAPRCGTAALWTITLALVCGCAGGKKSQVQAILPDETLYTQAIEALSRGSFNAARDSLERIQFNSDSRDLLQPLVRLALADTKFYQGDDISLIEARSKYLDFVTFFGDHPMAPYAQFQAGVCSLKQVSSPNKDQRQTHVAIADLRKVASRYPASPYNRASREMIEVAETYLAVHDFKVGKFYLTRKVPQAAENRFQNVLDKYPHYREREELYFYMSRALLKGQEDAEAWAYLQRLVEDYPDSDFAHQARKFMAKFPKQESLP